MGHSVEPFQPSPYASSPASTHQAPAAPSTPPCACGQAGALVPSDPQPPSAQRRGIWRAAIARLVGAGWPVLAPAALGSAHAQGVRGRTFDDPLPGDRRRRQRALWEVQILQEDGRHLVFVGTREPSRERNVIRLRALSNDGRAMSPALPAPRSGAVESLQGGFVSPRRRSPARSDGW